MPITRAVHAADADRLLRLQHAHQTSVLGRPDTTADDVADALADPDLHPGSSIVVDDDDDALACALVFPDGDSGRADLDVVADPARAAHLLPGLVEQARELAVAAARRAGAAEVHADQACYRDDTALAQVLDSLDFRPATTFHRMRRELDGRVEVRVPPGVVVEQVEQTEPALRRAHRLHLSTFAGHFGFVARPWHDWRAAHEARSGMGPLWFATLDGADVGFLHETQQFVADEDAGYVLRLGVEPAARGRGVAKALLLSSFAAMSERGRRAALLHVDSANATGATALYEAVGMRPVVVLDVWRWTGPGAG